MLSLAAIANSGGGRATCGSRENRRLLPAPAQEPAASPAPAEHYQVPRQEWTFGGLFGYFDEQQLRRGYRDLQERMFKLP